MATASLCTFEPLRVTRATMHAAAAEYPQGTLKGTPTYSNYSGTALYEACIASEEESE